MYKQVIEKHKNSIIGLFVAFLLLTIIISDLLSEINIQNYKVKVALDIAFFVVALFIFIKGVNKAGIKYKYSLIADQLLIHRIKGNSQIELENIKIRNIKFIGKLNELKDEYKGLKGKKYTCSLFEKNKYCCVYSIDGKIKKFYFRPNKELLDMLNKRLEKKEEYIARGCRLGVMA